ncbi:hypothetical protein CRV01_09805 [Arcobacter sp. CECT 8983]|uniref:hypothetical protein n=1 Tax=Arcobacter sp. CECT 8983 TaxID=2044508 RepID=UPI00100AA6B5|nr:hypothetical protein [Arcobacter sp. CECT 8983]RXJ88906.1 hypothetical protein CRV01_09805 [Arcobacter sp. CECT 8983]
MFSLLHLHIIAFIITLVNIIIFNKNISKNLGSKYFLINYIYHHHKQLSCFIIMYPFIIILIYFLATNIFLFSSFFIAILHVYFLYEIISKKAIVKREAYIHWYKQNVKHSLSMHTYDIFKKNFNFLNDKGNIFFLFKFEVIFLLCIIIESEVLNELFIIIDKIK